MRVRATARGRALALCQGSCLAQVSRTSPATVRDVFILISSDLTTTCVNHVQEVPSSSPVSPWVWAKLASTVLAGILGICRLLRAAVGFADDAGGDYFVFVAVIYLVANCVRDLNCCRCGV